MIITNKSFRKFNKETFQEIILHDFYKAYGALYIKYPDIYFSRPLTNEEITSSNIRNLKLDPAEMKIKRYSSKKKIIHLFIRNRKKKGAVETRFNHLFKKISPTEYSRLANDFTDLSVKVDPNLRKALDLQRKGNMLFRNIHSEYLFELFEVGYKKEDFSKRLNEIFSIAGQDPKNIEEKIRDSLGAGRRIDLPDSVGKKFYDYLLEFNIARTNLNIKGKRKKEQAILFLTTPKQIYQTAADIMGIKSEIDFIVKKIEKGNYSILDPDEKNIKIILNSQKGLSRSKEDVLTPARLEQVLENGGLGVNDLEVCDYKTDDPKIYLDPIYTRKNGRPEGVVFGFYSYPLEDLVGDEGEEIRYVRGRDQHEVRLRGGRMRGTRNFLLFGNHNLFGFDEVKCMNPKREYEDEKKLEGDGIFIVGIDNSEPFRLSEKSGKEIFNSKGSILIDSYVIAENYLSHMFTDCKLETVRAFISHFSGSGEKFKKAFTSYDELEKDQAEWGKGDMSKGKKAILYAWADCKEAYKTVKFFAHTLRDVAELIGCDLHYAANQPPKKLAKLYWEKRCFKEINSLKYWPHEFNEIKNKDLESICAEIADVPLFDMYKIRENKKRISGKYIIEKMDNLAETGVDMFCFPLITCLTGDIIVKDEQVMKFEEKTRNESNTLLKMMRYSLLDAIGSNILIDLHNWKSGDMSSSVFFAQYRKNPSDVEAEMTDKLRNHIRNLFLAKDVIKFTGDLLFVNGLKENDINLLKNEGLVHFGKVDTYNLSDSIVFRTGDLVSSVGIKIPSYKKRFHNSIDERAVPQIKINIIYDFFQDLFENRRKALENLAENSRKLLNNEFEKTDYLQRIKCKKDSTIEYSNQDELRTRIMRYFDMHKNETILFAAGRTRVYQEDGLIAYNKDTESDITKNFIPSQKYYRNIIFGEKGSWKKFYGVLRDVYRVGKKDRLKKESLQKIVDGTAENYDVSVLMT